MSTSFAGKDVMTATAAPKSHTVLDSGGKGLLSALVDFLQPVIQGYAASSVSDKAKSHNYQPDDELMNGMEGKNLLCALTAFVAAAAVHAPLETLSEEGELPPEDPQKQDDPPEPDAVMVVNGTSKVVPDLPKEVPRSELETKTLVAARAHVFNKMPIRLLAFDKNGSNIQLIGRNQVFSCILPAVFAKIAEPEFQSAWEKADALTDHEVQTLSMLHRQIKTQELLQRAVEQSVHYAILSHTWMRDAPGDVIFQDWATREHNPRGNSKIVKFCEVAALNHDVTLGWIDSVCINKESSSELDESIRSMYNWYRGASVCISFLADTSLIHNARGDAWFTRGWTLQELLAPRYSVFYNEDWNQLGSTKDTETCSVIERASGITCRELNLCWSGHIAAIPFSRRMQMACGRQVTREEDTSYSLMGILGVDISIAYGEGASRAFFRLIRELFNTKKNVMDLFNRSYNRGESLLPSSLDSYKYRANWWDHSNAGTCLDHLLPHKPIIPTHLGMRVPLLLAPLLATKSTGNANYTPKGDIYSPMTIHRIFHMTGATEQRHHHLLDSRLYTGIPADLHAIADNIMISMYGIINFGVNSSGNIQLPQRAMALSLLWNGLSERNFTPSGNVEIRSGMVSSFILKSKKGFEIPKAQLEEHGLQLVTLYL